MKKQILLIALFICLTNFINAQTSTFLLANKLGEAVTNKGFAITVGSKAETQSITLIVTCLTNRIQPPGGSFQHKVKLMNGTDPITNATIFVNDPIGRICTRVTTNSKGETTWTRRVPLDAKPLCYAIEFYYGEVKQYSAVSVKSPQDGIILPSYTMNLNSTDILDNHTLVMASRGGFIDTKQSIAATLQEAKKVGLAIIKDYWGNPVTEIKTILLVSSCTVAFVAPPTSPLTGPLCLVLTADAAKGLIITDFKLLLFKGIDATNISESNKVLLKNMLHLSTIAYAVLNLKTSEGLSKLDAIESGFDFVKNALSQLVYLNGKLKGVSIALQKAGSSEVYMMCMYNRNFPNQNMDTTNPNINTTNQIVDQPSKDPNCKENNTGDYCFQNNTGLNLKVTLMSSPSKKFRYTSPFSCTLQPGQKQCFFNVPAGAARYDIKTPATFSGYSNSSTSNPAKLYSAQGSVYVDDCRENSFFINLETPSYASNIPLETTEDKNVSSKDPDCNENYTGDYCFQNNTKLDLSITLMSSPSKKFSYTSPFTCTIQPGQQQCFFNLPAGPAQYEIKTTATFNGNNSGTVNSPPKTYFAKGSLYVGQCKKNIFIIK